jgi:hypothetical protein
LQGKEKHVQRQQVQRDDNKSYKPVVHCSGSRLAIMIIINLEIL